MIFPFVSHPLFTCWIPPSPTMEMKTCRSLFLGTIATLLHQCLTSVRSQCKLDHGMAAPVLLLSGKESMCHHRYKVRGPVSRSETPEPVIQRNPDQLHGKSTMNGGPVVMFNLYDSNAQVGQGRLKDSLCKMISIRTHRGFSLRSPHLSQDGHLALCNLCCVY